MKLIDNNSGFDCKGCMFNKDDKCCITLQAVEMGDCDVNTIFVEDEEKVNE